MGRLCGILVGFLIRMARGYVSANAVPTAGFTQQKLAPENFDIQKPYDKELYERYSFVDGVHSLWVYKNDKPHSNHSNTKPRTEIRITGYDYMGGVWQFEADMYIPYGTNGTSVMQVFGSPGIEHATALQLRVYDGQLKRYNAEMAECGYDRWIHLNVIHDADEGKVYVIVDAKEKLVAHDRGRANHYFKCGVYTQTNSSYIMVSRWKNIRVWTK